MNSERTDDHLSGISTMWTVIRDAHGPSATDVTAAQGKLLHRYRTAIYRYVFAFVRERESSEDICQEFAVRFVRGDFRNADPARGRFRDLVKTAVYNLMIDFIRRRNAQPRTMPDSAMSTPSVPPAEFESDKEFLRRWRAELLNRTWESLRASEPGGRRLFETLLIRVTHPKMESDEMARLLADRLQRDVNSATARQWLHRARELFATLLVEEVEQSLGEDSHDRVEQELIDLDLLSYCKPALKRRAAPAATGD